MKPQNVLIFGDGQLGTLYRKWYEARGANVMDAGVDIRKAEDVLNRVKDVGPDLVINAAAMTSIDWCEQNREEALLLTCWGRTILAPHVR